MTTLQTKKMLSAELKAKMEKKPLSKITVSEIVQDCGVNRKTFYYHFVDWYYEDQYMRIIGNIAIKTGT